LTDATLAVDSAVEPLTFWDLSTRNRVVLTSRSLLEVPSKERFDMPPLTRDEVEAWVKALRGTSTDAAELSRLVTRSSGNPLYLRLYALGGDSSADLALRELELRAVQALSPRAREITSYLALSSEPLSLGELQHLVGLEDGPDAVAAQIAIANGLLVQIKGRVQLVHDHLRETLIDQLRQSLTKLAFFASRLGRYLTR
jgi:hypothetical protein